MLLRPQTNWCQPGARSSSSLSAAQQQPLVPFHMWNMDATIFSLLCWATGCDLFSSHHLNKSAAHTLNSHWASLVVYDVYVLFWMDGLFIDWLIFPYDSKLCNHGVSFDLNPSFAAWLSFVMQPHCLRATTLPEKSSHPYSLHWFPVADVADAQFALSLDIYSLYAFAFV